MSEVKRFRADWRHVVETEFDDAQYVGVADFDRVTAERDALQERLNAADQKDDDQAFQIKDCEGSRRDWFEEAKRLEKEVEALRRALPNSTVELVDLRAQLAERDALLREVLHYDMCQSTGDGFNLSDLLQRINLTIGGRA
ncbi:hypothetical protein ACIPI6_15125 [Pseudomonas protegens]|uniref:hypothetical protein n=1 Tax=Pseudomonas protegens TaxID=380021 RepID=UPI0037F2D36A